MSLQQRIKELEGDILALEMNDTEATEEIKGLKKELEEARAEIKKLKGYLTSSGLCICCGKSDCGDVDG